MTSAEQVLLDWGLIGKRKLAGFISPLDSSSSDYYARAVILAQRSAEMRRALSLAKLYFEQHSFSGYVLPGDSELKPIELLDGQRSWWRTRLRVLRSRGTYFEDWNDGCGLKVWISEDALPRARRLLERSIQGPVRSAVS